MKYTIEQLNTPAQGVDVETLASLHHHEFGEGRLFDVNAVAHACAQCCLNPKRTYVNCWIAYTESGEAVGYIAGTIRASFYSFSRFACQEMWFVVPEHRGSMASVRLVQAFEQWAHDNKCEMSYMTVEHEHDQTLVSRILRLMYALGYTPRGYIAVKKHNYAQEELKDDRTTRSKVGAGQATAQH